MSARPDRLVPGAARASGESLRDLLMADGRPPPDVLLTESYEFLGDADIAFERHTSPEFAAAEAEHLWPRVGQWACRAEHIPEPGDYYVHDVGDLSALIVRTASGEIMAYANACMHRGTQLEPPGSCGWSRVRETHAAGAAGTDVHAQYDVFGANVSRFIHTIATRNPAVHPPLSEQEHLAQIMGSKLAGAPVPELPPGTLARDFYAAWHRDQLSARYGRDLSHLSTSETLDSIEYFLFPNAFFFPGLTLPMACRFRPDGRDPDHSLFDLLILRPSPEDGPAPAPAEVVRLDVGDSYTQVESLGNLGRVFDEDTVNMGAQTRGFKASRKRGQTLGNYQEVRVRHLHLRVDECLARDNTNTPSSKGPT